MVLLLAGYLVIISKSFLVTEKGKELVEASAIETNKMLGLSFQGQGMLDIAFEKFRRANGRLVRRFDQSVDHNALDSHAFGARRPGDAP